MIEETRFWHHVISSPYLNSSGTAARRAFSILQVAPICCGRTIIPINGSITFMELNVTAARFAATKIAAGVIAV